MRIGLPGTGKSTAASYFRQGAKKRQFNIAHVQAKQGDETIQYGIMSRYRSTFLFFLPLLHPLPLLLLVLLFLPFLVFLNVHMCFMDLFILLKVFYDLNATFLPFLSLMTHF